MGFRPLMLDFLPLAQVTLGRVVTFQMIYAVKYYLPLLLIQRVLHLLHLVMNDMALSV